ncbi:MAG TPA: FMN-binding protein [Longimicrobiales bacterium]
MNGMHGGAAPDVKPAAPAARLVSTLAVAGAIAGLLIVTVHQWAEPRILSHQARVIAAAVDEVLQGPAQTRTLYVHDGALVATPPAGLDTLKLERIWAGYDAGGRTIGYALMAGEPGFQDVINVIFGYDPATGRVLGMRVLDNKETPGLGDRIVKDTAWVAQFSDAGAPLVPTKPGNTTGDPHEVETITGATISSRAVIAIINNRIERMRPLLEQAGSMQ